MADFHCIESEKINTPKKIYISTDNGCRLCGNINDRMLNLFHKPSQKKNLVKHVTDTLGITICENDEMSQLMCRCCERKLMKFIEFRDSVQDFQTRIKSNISIKRCNTSTEEPNKKRMSADTGNIIHMQSTVSHTNRELFIEQTPENVTNLQSESSTSDSNVVNIQDVNSLNCNIEGHDMGTLPIDPTTVVVTDTNVSKWYMQ